jgi:hypothetical protein
MPRRWLTLALREIRRLAAQRKMRFTLKAFQEIGRLGLELDQDDACDVLANLAPSDFVTRLVSENTGEWMYVFKPSVGGFAV